MQSIDPSKINGLKEMLGAEKALYFIENFLTRIADAREEMQKIDPVKDKHAFIILLHDFISDTGNLGLNQLSDFSNYVRKKAEDGTLHSREFENLKDMADSAHQELLEMLETK